MIMKERKIEWRITIIITSVQMKTMTVHHTVGPVVFTLTSSSPTPSSLHDDRIPAVMYLCVFEGHPDRQGYHRHNLTAL